MHTRNKHVGSCWSYIDTSEKRKMRCAVSVSWKHTIHIWWIVYSLLHNGAYTFSFLFLYHKNVQNVCASATLWTMNTIINTPVTSYNTIKRNSIRVQMLSNWAWMPNYLNVKQRADQANLKNSDRSRKTFWQIAKMMMSITKSSLCTFVLSLQVLIWLSD